VAEAVHYCGSAFSS